MKKAGLFVLLAAVITGIYFRQYLTVEAVEQYAKNAGMAGMLVFILVYAAGTVLFLPGSVMTLAGGALYGPFTGTLVNLSGATLGATVAFFIARYLASDWVAAKTGGRLKALKDGIEAEDWKFVAFTRLVPFFPFNLLNYALGLTKIRPLRYVLCTFGFMIPGGFAYTWLGHLGKEAATNEKDMVRNILYAIAVFSLALFIPKIAGFFRKGKTISVAELEKLLGSGKIDLLLDVRSAKEFSQEPGHIKNARNIPDNVLYEDPAVLDEYLEKKVAVICRTDKRSAKAAGILAKRGFSDVHIVSGGMIDWQDKGLPVVQGEV